MSQEVSKEEILIIQKSIQKCFESFHQNASFDGILDSIIALDKIVFTANLIHETKIGPTIRTLRTNCINLVKDESISKSVTEKVNNIAEKSKDLLLKLKKIVESSQKDKHSENVNIIKSPKSKIQSSQSRDSVDKSKPDIKTDENNSKHDSEDTSAIVKSSKGTIKLVLSDNMEANTDLVKSRETDKSRLPQQRQKVINNFMNIFDSKQCTSKEAESLAISIERAVHEIYNIAVDNKGYINKCRTLSFNLKNNQTLRNCLVNNLMLATDLVKLSTNELANSEVIVKRLEIDEKAIDERRSDWYEHHREEILKVNEIDPNNTWQYDINDDSGSEPDVAGD